MNREEFLRRLENLLADIPENDRNEAITFYTDYFEDAGVENEQKVIVELGSPETVAKIIKQDLQGEGVEKNGEYTEKGYQNSYYEQHEKQEVVRPESINQSEERTEYYTTNEDEKDSNEEESKYTYVHKIPVAIWVILAVIGIPLIIPVAVTVFGLLIALLVVPAAVLFAFGITSVVLVVTGGGLVLCGILKLIVLPLNGIAIAGVGLLLFGLGLLFFLATKFFVFLLGVIGKGIVATVRLLFGKRVTA